MWICKHCSKGFDGLNTSEKANHTKWCDKNPKRKSYLQTLEHTRNNISILAREQQAKSLSKAHKEGRLPDPPSFEGKFHSEETKKLLSKKRKKYLQENPDKHPWKNSKKFTSEPCEFIKKKLAGLGILFEEEYQPLKTRFFSLDIAFLDQKIGLEINGHQHYNKDGSLKAYYQERHDLISKGGWKLLEIPHYKAYKEETFQEILNTINYDKFFRQEICLPSLSNNDLS